MTWLDQEIEKLKASSKDYKDRALLHVLHLYLKETQKRIDDAKGQLDGQMWSPRDW